MKVNTGTLRDAVRAAAKFVKGGDDTPTGGITVSHAKDGPEITLMASSGIAAVLISVPCTPGLRNDRSVTGRVNHRQLLAGLEASDKEDMLTIGLSDNAMSVAGVGVSFSLGVSGNVLSPNTQATLLDPGSYGYDFSADAQELATALHATAAATSGVGPPFAASVKLEVDGMLLHLVASDGRSICHVALMLERDKPWNATLPLSGLIPLEEIPRLCMALRTIDGRVGIHISPSHIGFYSKDVRVITGLLDGRFPRWEPCFENPTLASAGVKVADLVAVMKTAVLFKDDKEIQDDLPTAIFATLSADGLRIRSGKGNRAFIKDLDITAYVGNPNAIDYPAEACFNGKLVLKALAVLGREAIIAIEQTTFAVHLYTPSSEGTVNPHFVICGMDRE